MSGFAADWLALREPADHAARSLPGPRALAQLFGERVRNRNTGCVRLVDLAGGTGSNIRFLAPAIKGRQDWTLWDTDAALLTKLLPQCATWAQTQGWDAEIQGEVLHVEGAELALRIRGERRDLRDGLDVTGFDGVSSAALLDLVSVNWCESLIEALEGADRPPLLCSLVADGSWTWDPPLPGDVAAARHFSADMRRDKGFGPALGHDGVETIAEMLGGHGFDVRRAHSPWRLGADAAALQSALLDFQAELPGTSADWLTARRGLLGRQILRLGHGEVFASR